MSVCQLTMVLCAYGDNPFLQEAALSLSNQTAEIKVILATSTPSEYIKGIADKYGFDYRINPIKGGGIGADWEFAASCAKTQYVTIAHQDDIYFPDYAKNVIDAFEHYPASLIVFTNSCDKINGTFYSNRSYLKIKRLLLWAYYIKKSYNLKIFKAMTYCLGNAICCPSVTYNVAKTGALKFDKSFSSNLDWQKWIDLAQCSGNFTYVKKIMMAHRIDESTATSALIKNNCRYNEDLRILNSIWGKTIAKMLMLFYKNSYKMSGIK